MQSALNFEPDALSIQLRLLPTMSKYLHVLASFPGSPHVRTKNEKGEPGKIYHMRNVTGRENLITCGQTNKLAHALLTEYTQS